MFLLSLTRYISSFIWIIRPREYKFSLELKKLKLHKNWNYWEAFYYHAIFLYPVKHQQWSLIKYNRNSLKMWIFYRHYQLMEMDIPFKVTIKYWLYSLWCIIYSWVFCIMLRDLNFYTGGNRGLLKKFEQGGSLFRIWFSKILMLLKLSLRATPCLSNGRNVAIKNDNLSLGFSHSLNWILPAFKIWKIIKGIAWKSGLVPFI